jgi:uncharacterized LabA/DUF88 family protein
MKTIVFIDGHNFYRTAKALNIDIDFKKLLVVLNGLGRSVRTIYYTCVDDDAEDSRIVPLLDWLNYNGYSVFAKSGRAVVDADGRSRLHGRIDVELTVDALQLSRHLDQVVLVSGSGEFTYLVEALKREGKRCIVIASVVSDAAVCADSLRRQADEFIELRSLAAKIQRDGAPRSERKIAFS